jgi:hypothetical protein
MSILLKEGRTNECPFKMLRDAIDLPLFDDEGEHSTSFKLCLLIDCPLEYQMKLTVFIFDVHFPAMMHP